MRIFNVVRDRVIEIVVALVVLHLVINGIELRQEEARRNVPATDWFEVHEVFVPDHVTGSNPFILYDRTIRSDFTGMWVVEAQRREPSGGFSNACSGSGVDDYTRYDNLPEDGVTWTWFFGRPCPIEPGTYRLSVVYDMRKPEYPMKRYRTLSNVFNVLPVPSGR